MHFRELFPAQINDDETTRILNQRIGAVGGQVADDFDYINKRRHLLGPVADIRHPEFGRPNLPAETFSVTYIMREEEVLVQPPRSVKPEKKINLKVFEFIADNLGNHVSIEDIQFRSSV